mmetsp:Transcript_46988/g.75055  ORF Transcript_46988/g.75055 Transcript_46988/m.75055 type:complete len:128 (-) Transcript_46988:102-485(-)
MQVSLQLSLIVCMESIISFSEIVINFFEAMTRLEEKITCSIGAIGTCIATMTTNTNTTTTPLICSTGDIGTCIANGQVGSVGEVILAAVGRFVRRAFFAAMSRVGFVFVSTCVCGLHVALGCGVGGI